MLLRVRLFVAQTDAWRRKRHSLSGKQAARICQAAVNAQPQHRYIKLCIRDVSPYTVLIIPYPISCAFQRFLINSMLS